MAKPLKRGLNALLADIEDVKEYVKTEDKIYSVPITQVEANPDQPRKRFDDESLKELADSIRSNGIIQPIIVRRSGDGGYVIIAGERRYRASLLAGLDKIPVMIKDYEDIKIKEISLIENLQREDLNPIEEAAAIQELMKAYSLTQEEIAQKLGKSRPGIANSLRLLNLPIVIREWVIDGKLSAGHARALLSLNNEKTQIKIAQKAIDENMSVREVERQVKAIIDGETIEEKKKIVWSDTCKSFAADMSKLFSTKVHFSGNESKGKISIDYRTPEELERIYRILNSLK